jgi:hypothetical protein
MDQQQMTAPVPTDDGMDDGVHFFEELVAQVSVWSHHNFGDQPAWRPAMGMVEELCELSEKFEELDLAETLDAIGDTVIYMADYYHRRGWDLGDVWVNRHLRAGRGGSPSSRTITLIKEICHSHLKGDQGIRGGSEKHDDFMRQTCAAALVFLEETAGLLDRDIIHVVQEVWAVVRERDWKKNPDTAHMVAANSGGLVPAGEQ